MSRQKFKHNAALDQLFDELDEYKQFCVEYGYRYDEATLYNMEDYVYRNFSRARSGKDVKDNWMETHKRLYGE